MPKIIIRSKYTLPVVFLSAAIMLAGCGGSQDTAGEVSASAREITEEDGSAVHALTGESDNNSKTGSDAQTQEEQTEEKTDNDAQSREDSSRTGTTGQVSAKAAGEEDATYEQEDAPVVNTEDDAYFYLSSEKYSYEELEQDIDRLEQNYPGQLRASVLGTTLDERKLYDICVGNEDAAKHILIIGDMHAREYISGQLVARQLGDLLRRANTEEGEGENRIADMLERVEIHFVPMDNPDGVSISQYGMAGLQTTTAIERVKEIAALDGQEATGEYLTQWKANANGVDVNRNFDAKWEEYQNVSHPSSDHYKGTAPGSEIEAACLIDLTKEYLFDATVSYHTMGEVIYWNFDQQGELKVMGEALADAAKQLTGYTIDGNYQALDAAGYKDWAISKMNIPSLTIEVGHGDNPVDPAQFGDIWEQNQGIVPMLLEKVDRGETHRVESGSGKDQKTASTNAAQKATLQTRLVTELYFNPDYYHVVSASASSEATDYPAANLIDGDFRTAWSENESGLGIGTTITLTLDGTHEIHGFEIVAGYTKSAEIANNNASPSELGISCGGKEGEVNLPYPSSISTVSGVQSDDEDLNEYYRRLFIVEFTEPVQDNQLTLTILDGKRGAKWEDLCISEIYVY